MKICMIAAMAKNRVIGKDNKMPWHLPADLKHFKQTTLGHPVIMGRKTYESIGKALPGRKNIVVTSNQAYSLNDAVVVNSCESALKVAQLEAQTVMIIGGGTIYESFLPHANTLYLTHIDLDVEGDTTFPDYNSVAKWQVDASQKHLKDDKNPHNYEFVTLIKSA
ncbi:type 3 dihydrofolate reductase [Glaciecola petra]|uniref:Dihydrofolate reductase n=1 Tax=Glaciecola petra TaxID=3075602 RepID=A0ABU2ZNX8_9ALTE|nr:type 3 dihydrofolate reductase [Aestuariibacter sp. P117]MDT0593284.1 type 3 dihydrofolate reductase [Aestuariibacter sp. P117]